MSGEDLRRDCGVPKASYKVGRRLGEIHGNPLDARSTELVVVATLEGGLCPVVDVFHLI